MAQNPLIRWCTSAMAAAAMLLTAEANGFPAGLIAFQGHYPLSQSDEHAGGTGCRLWHDSDTVVSGAGRWNAYGNAIKRIIDTDCAANGGPGTCTRLTAGQVMIRPEVEAPNSDGDPGGATNLQEINASTQPGWRPGNVNTIYDSTGAVVLSNQPPPAGVLPNLDPPSISVDSPSVTEGNSGTGTLVFTVTLSVASTDANVTVDYATSDLIATAGSDYTPANGSLTFAPGVLTQTIPVVVQGDIVSEPNETLRVTLSNPLNATLSVTQGTGTIVNDDVTATGPTTAVPTLSTWNLLGLGVLLAAGAAGILRSRRSVR